MSNPENSKQISPERNWKRIVVNFMLGTVALGSAGYVFNSFGTHSEDIHAERAVFEAAAQGMSGSDLEAAERLARDEYTVGDTIQEIIDAGILHTTGLRSRGIPGTAQGKEHGDKVAERMFMQQGHNSLSQEGINNLVLGAGGVASTLTLSVGAISSRKKPRGD